MCTCTLHSCMLEASPFVLMSTEPEMHQSLANSVTEQMSKFSMLPYRINAIILLKVSLSEDSYVQELALRCPDDERIDSEEALEYLEERQ